jgi:hypothetical protein
MSTVLTVLTLASGLFALLTGVFALRAGLRLRRTYLGLRRYLYTEVTQLTSRTSEVERSLTALDARIGALPVRVRELQQNLATLRILSGTLGNSLRQAQKALSSTGLKSPLAWPSIGAFNDSPGGRGGAGRDDEAKTTRL